MGNEKSMPWNIIFKQIGWLWVTTCSEYADKLNGGDVVQGMEDDICNENIGSGIKLRITRI